MVAGHGLFVHEVVRRRDLDHDKAMYSDPNFLLENVESIQWSRLT